MGDLFKYNGGMLGYGFTPILPPFMPTSRYNVWAGIKAITPSYMYKISLPTETYITVKVIDSESFDYMKMLKSEEPKVLIQLTSTEVMDYAKIGNKLTFQFKDSLSCLPSKESLTEEGFCFEIEKEEKNFQGFIMLGKNKKDYYMLMEYKEVNNT